MCLHALRTAVSAGIGNNDGQRYTDALSVHRFDPAELTDRLLEVSTGFRCGPVRFQRRAVDGKGVRELSPRFVLCGHRHRLRVGVHDTGIDLLVGRATHYHALNANHPWSVADHQDRHDTSTTDLTPGDICCSQCYLAGH